MFSLLATRKNHYFCTFDMEKKRILIANKFYYPRGGDCIVAMNLERLLKEQGHEVAVFAMQYPENVDSGWNSYYASQVDFAGGLGNKLKAAKRLMGWGDIKSAFGKILNDFNPHIVHLHNIHSYLSPVLAKLAKQRGCRVVWTMHDLKLVCPSYLCLCNEKPCERCIGRGKMHVLKNRCLKNSLAASAMAYIEALKWNHNALERYTDAFICPSQFMESKMLKDGFSPEKLHVVCNHIDPEKLQAMHNAQCTKHNEERGSECGRVACRPRKAWRHCSMSPPNCLTPLKLPVMAPSCNNFKSNIIIATILSFLDGSTLSKWLNCWAKHASR